ncbi:hypothetical protein GA0116948_11514 [Chitinophaga costaii]|uniref:Uncharacterized protein n=2 Tax=Chitinophaga costaii TaxID=1335309 RepID=A0A1C4FKB2_9BACT|nr:hypothetical protein GA0116948_11514 [Chitinophaga costaii]
MLDFIEETYATNKPGTAEDADFILDDFWLQDTVVIENIERRHGAWNIFLVFAHHLQPLKLIKRSITNFSSLKKAALTAHYMRRLAAKDQRGTMYLNAQSININLS